MAGISSNEQTESLMDNSSSLGTKVLGYGSVHTKNLVPNTICQPQGYEEMHDNLVTQIQQMRKIVKKLEGKSP